MVAPLLPLNAATADAVRSTDVLPRPGPRPFAATQQRRILASRAKSRTSSHTSPHLPDAGLPGIKYVSGPGPQSSAHRRKMQL
jgi:hypothetical protein